MTRDQVLAKLAESFQQITQEYPVASLSIFGSIARDEARPDSDIDILVVFNAPIGLFKFAGLQRRLADILGRQVDLVMKDAIRPQWRDQILKEAIRAA